MSEQDAPGVSSLLAPTRHSAVFGRGPESLAATAVGVFAGARASGEALLLLTDDADPALLDALPERDALLAGGRLQLLRTADAYPHRDPVRLLAAFDEVLRGALAAGWTGIRVVAENTAMVRGGDEAFADWLAWEHLTSRWQAANPVVGVCWFDVDALDTERVADLAGLHAERHGLPEPVPFRLFPVEGVTRLEGDVDAADVHRLVRLLGLVPHDGELVVDLSGAGYVHHTVFPALEFAPFEADRIRLTGAREVLRRVWGAVGRSGGRVDVV